MQIEVGKRYRTKRWDVFEIKETTDYDLYPFRGVVVAKASKYVLVGDVEVFTSNGLWIVGERSEIDLIEEMPEQ